MQNPTPKLYQKYQLTQHQQILRKQLQFDDSVDDPFDSLQIFQMIRGINDPQYPLTLQQLGVVSVERCFAKSQKIQILYTPTIPHCSMAQIIGLMIKVKLQNGLPRTYKTVVRISPGTHVKEVDINKQINDKERVAAAVENPNIVRIIQRGFLGADKLQ